MEALHVKVRLRLLPVGPPLRFLLEAIRPTQTFLLAAMSRCAHLDKSALEFFTLLHPSSGVKRNPKHTEAVRITLGGTAFLSTHAPHPLPSSSSAAPVIVLSNFQKALRVRSPASFALQFFPQQTQLLHITAVAHHRQPFVGCDSKPRSRSCHLPRPSDCLCNGLTFFGVCCVPCSLLPLLDMCSPALIGSDIFMCHNAKQISASCRHYS